jgi:hypothetical protein
MRLKTVGVMVPAMTILLIACGLDAGTVAAPEAPQIHEMRCGGISAPWSDEAPPLGEIDDPDLALALEWFEGNEEGRFWVDTVEWSVWEKADDEMTLYGMTEDGFADAVFINTDGAWRASGWGGCDWRVHVEGFGVAEWRVDGPADAGTTSLTIAATERNCASGQAPDGREVKSLVMETDETVTIVVLVEPVSGAATCQGNPEFPVTIELESPLGERSLRDGSVIPPVSRDSE